MKTFTNLFPLWVLLAALIAYHSESLADSWSFCMSHAYGHMAEGEGGEAVLGL